MARTSEKSPKVAKKAAAKRVVAKPALLSGSNPRIAKADGDAPVQAYIVRLQRIDRKFCAAASIDDFHQSLLRCGF